MVWPAFARHRCRVPMPRRSVARALAGDDYEMDEKENEPLDCSSNSESPARKRPCRSQSISIGSSTVVNKQIADRTSSETGAAAVRCLLPSQPPSAARLLSESALVAETKSPMQTRQFGGGGGLSDMQVGLGGPG
jgi:hypothetical protein